jgi:hypothetical protein
MWPGRWRRQPAPEPEPRPEPELERTLSDAEVHATALGVVIAAAYVPDTAKAEAIARGDLRSLLTGLSAADLIEVCEDVAAFSVVAFKIQGWRPERVRRAFQHLAYLQAAKLPRPLKEPLPASQRTPPALSGSGAPQLLPVTAETI